MGRIGLLLGLLAGGPSPVQPTSIHAQGSLPEGYALVESWPARPQARPVGEFDSVAGLAVDPASGRVYAVDPVQGRVHILDREGRGLGQIGRPGSGFGELNRPQDLALAGDRIYVSDSGNGRVQVFDLADGRFLAAWPDLGRPWGLAAAGDRIYLSDADRPILRLLDRAGRLLAVWGEGDALAGTLVRPRGLDLGDDGLLRVADPGAEVIHVIGPDGSLRHSLRRSASNEGFRALDVAADGPTTYALAPRQVFAFDSLDQSEIFRLGSYVEGGVGLALGPGMGLVIASQDLANDFRGILPIENRARLAQPDIRWGSVPVALGQLEGPRRIAASQEGVFLLDGRPRIQRWSRSGGQPELQWREELAQDLAPAPAGGLYIARPGGIARLGPDGSVAWEWADELDRFLVAIAATRDGPRAIDLGRQRFVAISERGPQSMFFEAPLGGFVIDAAGAGERIILAEAERLRLLNPEGEEIASWPARGRLARVAASRDGASFFALDREGWIWKYDAAGDLLAAWATSEGAAVDLEVDHEGRVLVLDGSENRILVYAPDAQAPRPIPPEPGPGCRLRRDKQAEPAKLRLGESLEVRLRIWGDCPQVAAPLDAVLVLDRSGSMAGRKLTAAQAAGLAFVNEMDLSAARLGVVGFGSEARLEQGLSADPGKLAAALARLQAGGQTAIHLGLRAGRLALQADAIPGRRQAIVLLTDGQADLPNSSRTEARAAAEAGILLHAIGLGGDLDEALLRELAGDPERYHAAPREAELAGIFAAIARRLAAEGLLESAEIIDAIPDNMQLEAGSVTPPASWDGRRLRWQIGPTGPEGLALRYRLKPLELGLWPTNVAAHADYVDALGQAGRLDFPIPQVRVLGQPSAYLPFAFQDRCAGQRSDVVLLIDSSTSMREAAGPRGSKLDAARQAARAFLGYLRLPSDRAALVAFNGEARILAPLGSDRASLFAALDALPLASGTRIDLGLEAATLALSEAGGSEGRRAVVVLLTDGRPAGGSEIATREAAASLRSAGTALFTIGLGADADGALLIELAADPERYSQAPDLAALERIYRTIAWGLPCR